MPALPTQTTRALSTAASPLSRQTGTLRGARNKEMWASCGRKTGGTGMRQTQIFLKGKLEECPRGDAPQAGGIPLCDRPSEYSLLFIRQARATRAPPAPVPSLRPLTPFRDDVNLHGPAGVLVNSDLYPVSLVFFADVIFDVVGRVAVDRDRVPHVTQHPAVSLRPAARAQMVLEPFRPSGFPAR